MDGAGAFMFIVGGSTYFDYVFLHREVRIKEEPQVSNVVRKRNVVSTNSNIDVGEQLEEGREGAEKKTASVLSSLSFSRLLHIHDLMSPVPDCRSRVRVCMSFGGVDF